MTLRLSGLQDPLPKGAREPIGVVGKYRRGFSPSPFQEEGRGEGAASTVPLIDYEK